mgnify:CR=1 FL=1
MLHARRDKGTLLNPCPDHYCSNRLLRLALLAASCALVACAQTPTQPGAAATPTAASRPLPKVVSPTRPPAPRNVPLPHNELSETLLFKLTLAEIAAQRGQPHVAVPAYLEVARETKDPRVARRAAEIAWSARFMPAALEAATLWLQADPGSAQARQRRVKRR